MAPFKLQNGPHFLQVHCCHHLVPDTCSAISHTMALVRSIATEAILVEAIFLVLGLVSLCVVPSGVLNAGPQRQPASSKHNGKWSPTLQQLRQVNFEHMVVV